MKQRVVNFPSNPPYGTTHYEHGRTWEFVEPGMWRSVSGGIEIEWDDISNKPDEYPPEAHNHQQSDVDGLEERLDQIEQSIGNGGGSGGGGDVYWDDVLDKPVQIKNLAAENAGKVSMISGGSY